MFPYSNNKFLTSLETSIRILNAAALDFEDQPAHRQVAALSTYKLTEYEKKRPFGSRSTAKDLFHFFSAQQTSQTLNIVTGFHLFDEENHLFVLEGRKDEAIDLIFKKLPKPQGESRISNENKRKRKFLGRFSFQTSKFFTIRRSFSANDFTSSLASI